MAPSPPATKSKKKRASNVLQRGIGWARDAMSSNSSPRSSTILTASPSTPQSGKFNSPNSSSPPGLDTSLNISVVPVLTTDDIIAANSFQEVSGVALNGLKTVLKVLEKSSDVFPPLKSVVAGLLACLDVVEAAAGNHDDYNDLSAELTTMAATVERVSKLASEDRDGSIVCILQSIKAEATHIKQQQAHGLGRRIFESPQDREDVLKRFRRIESLFRRLQSDVSVRTWDTTRKIYETSLLQGLSSVDAAEYDSSYSTTIKRRACTNKTRERIRGDVEDWVMDPNGAKVYWMNGMAGTGKTTILYSLCQWLEENRRLGGNFFCSRLLDSCRNANNILPTLAYQLAQYSLAFRTALCNVLDEKSGAGKREVKRQFEKLILEPMKEVKDSIPEGVVLVIDALDECDDSSVVRLLLGVILEHAEKLPIKFVVTSRPEPVIRNQMLERGFKPSVLHLHDIEESIVESDIKIYLAEELRNMLPTPSSDQVEQLAKRAGKLFIYAATAVRYIYPEGISVDSVYRLETVLNTVPSSESNKQHEDLDKLYTSILLAAFHEKLEDRESRNIRLVLQTVICAKEPLSIQTLASLLDLEEYGIKLSLEPLRSVLHVQDGGGLVSALHASFPDYMFDNRRSTPSFFCDQTQHNEVLANGCFDVMKSQLRFNICNLESSFTFDSDIDDLDRRIKTSISRGLSYACRYWGDHLRQGEFTDAVHKKLVDFLTHRLLFWMEVLNLEGRMAVGGNTLWRIQNWLESSLIDTGKLVADAEAFVTRYTAGACTRSTPHIYISGLPFCPRSSSVYKNFYGRTRGLINMKGSAAGQLSEAAISTWTTNAFVHSVAFSPDGTHIVSGSGKIIQVWDARTGDIVAGPFEGHTGAVNSVAFSPDSTHIVSGSDDGTIRVWNVRTGDDVAMSLETFIYRVFTAAFSSSGNYVVSGSGDKTVRIWDARTGDAIAEPFRGHTDWVQSVTFSPDDNQIASGSGDATIRVWDVRTGDAIGEPFRGHTDRICSIAFSPDGTQIVSGSEDYTIRVWDARTGNTIAGPFEGHIDQVRSVTFSPDGTRIVSGSDDNTIQVCDARTGDIVVGPFKGHTYYVVSVAFSPDGTRIVSGSEDNTIRVWDARISNIVTGSFEGHTDWIRSVAYSPDGKRIASGSHDDMIRIWDAHTGHAVAVLKGHTSWVRSVAFSPDGTRIVSGSWDTTIRVWDGRTGDTIAGPFEGHTGQVRSVAFSPDGTRIVSGSDDKTIRVLDAQSGNIIAGPFEGHTDAVASVAFSPDGTKIASGSDDNTIRVWDAQTGNMVVGPLKGHTDWVRTIAYSPDGTLIASGSYDRTIRLWDAYTGDAIGTQFKGHTRRVLSVTFSPDGTRIISGSYDAKVRVLDVLSGEIVAGPFEGHTGIVTSVAFSPDNTHIASCSIDCAIRVWDAHAGDAGSRFTDISLTSALPSYPDSISSYVEDFMFNQDGWLTAKNIPIFWVSPHSHPQIPQPRNTVLIGPQGTTTIDYHNLNIGDTWSECFLP